MALETATYITGLNGTNPPDGDPVAQASNHLRLIKTTLLNTFPNFSAPVTTSSEKANNGNVPTGTIVVWSSTGGAIPTGWALCNGGSYARADGTGTIGTPDLRDRFVVGAGYSYGNGTVGGQASTIPTISVGIAGHAVTYDEMPSHTHGVTDGGHNHSVNDPGHNHGYVRSNSQSYSFSGGGAGANAGVFNTGTDVSATGISLNASTSNVAINYAGNGNPHTHGASASSSVVPTIPPYYALYYIMRL